MSSAKAALDSDTRVQTFLCDLTFLTL